MSDDEDDWDDGVKKKVSNSIAVELFYLISKFTSPWLSLTTSLEYKQQYSGYNKKVE